MNRKYRYQPQIYYFGKKTQNIKKHPIETPLTIFLFGSFQYSIVFAKNNPILLG